MKAHEMNAKKHLPGNRWFRIANASAFKCNFATVISLSNDRSFGKCGFNTIVRNGCFVAYKFTRFCFLLVLLVLMLIFLVKVFGIFDFVFEKSDRESAICRLFLRERSNIVVVLVFLVYYSRYSRR